MSRTLYVGNLPFAIGEAELHDLFTRAGEVETINIVRDQMTGRPRGFAFVEMRSDDGAQAAIRELHETEVGGRSLTVNEARPKTPRSGGFRPDGGGGRSFGGDGGSARRPPRW